MKFLFAIIVIVAVAEAIREDYIETIQQNTAECQKEHDMDDEIIAKMRAKDYTSSHPNMNQFWGCELRKAGFLDAEGTFSKDNINNYLTEAERDHVNEVLDKCLEKTQITESNSYELILCLHKADPDIVVF